MMNGDAGPWSCDMCTFVNQHGAKMCSMCNKTRPDSPEVIPSVFKKTRKTDGDPKGVIDLSNEVVKYNAKEEKVTVPDKQRSQGAIPKNKKDNGFPVKGSVVVKKTVAPAKAGKAETAAVRPAQVGKTGQVGKPGQNNNGGKKQVGPSSADKKQPLQPKAEDQGGMDYEWVCDKCSVTNAHYFDSCICCHKEKNSDVVYIMEESKDKRSKSNSAGDRNKGKGPKKKEGLDKSKAENQEWTCRRCTLSNPVSTSKCSLCEAPRFPNIPSPESIPNNIDYSKFPPSARPPVGPGCSIVTPPSTSDQKPPSTNVTDSKKVSKEENNTKMKGMKAVNGNTHKVVKPAGVKPAVATGQPVSRPSNGKGPVKPANNLKTTPPQKKDSKVTAEEKEKQVRDSMFWSCGRCTFQNPNKADACEMCHAEKGSKKVGQMKWVCSRCTFLNEQANELCSVCSNKKGEVKQQHEDMEVDSPRDGDTQPKEPQPSTSKQKSPTLPKKSKQVTPLKTNLKPDLHCRMCTYLNESTSGPCIMCGTMLSILGEDTVVSPGTLRPRHTLQRQQSALVRDLREIEDSEALELWQHITMFCKQVTHTLD